MSVNDKLTAIADAIRSKTKGTDLLTLDEMAQHAGREWVEGIFNDIPQGDYEILVFANTLEHTIQAPVRIYDGSSMALVEKYSYVKLPRAYNWVIEPAENLVQASIYGDEQDYYLVKGDFSVTCTGKKFPFIILDRNTSPVDEYGELRPPIVAKIYGTPTYASWVGICDEDVTDYSYDKVHDHWGFVQLGGDNIGGVYQELNTSLIPPDGINVVISRGNLCRNGNSVLTPGKYKIVLFRDNIYGDSDGTYDAVATASFTLT